MPSCKNCIHRDFCNIHGYIDADECGCFKDKADFVEVVRCKDCAKRYTKNCNAKHERADMDFCSSGIR